MDKRFAEITLLLSCKTCHSLQRIIELWSAERHSIELINQWKESEIDWNEIVLQVLNKKFLTNVIN